MGLKLALVNNGDRIELSSVDPTDFFREIGAQGFGVAPTSLTVVASVNDGGYWKRTRRESRDIDIPVVIFGESAPEIELKMRRLTRLLNDYFTAPTLIQQYEDGTTFSIECHMASGGDPAFGKDTDTRHWARWPITLRCPDPYWVSDQSTQYSLTQSEAVAGILPNLSRLELSPGSTIGEIVVTNPGDVLAYPVWQVKGPGTRFEAVRNSDGATFSYEYAIEDTETITFNTITKRVTDQDDVSRYNRMGTAPKFFGLYPGDGGVTITLESATEDSRVSFNFQPRRELVFG